MKLLRFVYLKLIGGSRRPWRSCRDFDASSAGRFCIIFTGVLLQSGMQPGFSQPSLSQVAPPAFSPFPSTGPQAGYPNRPLATPQAIESPAFYFDGQPYYSNFPLPLSPVPMSPWRIEGPTPFDYNSGPIGQANYVESQLQYPYEVARPSPTPISFPAAHRSGNLKITVSERFINRLIARNESHPGEVRDFILGAEVMGNQLTHTHLEFDLTPSSESIMGAFVLTGTTESKTTGVTSQAVINTDSRQQFTARKEILFNGTNFLTKRATVEVQAQNQTVGAMTPLSGTLFGGIADRIAYRMAERRQPEAEAIASEKVVERVYPEFNGRIDKELAQANRELETKLRGSLRMTNLLPTLQQVSSSDHAFNYSAQVGPIDSAATPTHVDDPFLMSEGVSVLVHESLINHIVEASGLKGFKTTDKQIKQFLAPYEMKSARKDTVELPPSMPSFSIPGMSDLITEIEFDEEHPATIRIEPEAVEVTLRATFKPAGQQLVPPLAITIDYVPELVNSKLVVTPGNVRVRLQNEDAQTATTAMTLKLITTSIEATLSPLGMDLVIPASSWPTGSAIPQVVKIQSLKQWSSILIY